MLVVINGMRCDILGFTYVMCIKLRILTNLMVLMVATVTMAVIMLLIITVMVITIIIKGLFLVLSNLKFIVV